MAFVPNVFKSVVRLTRLCNAQRYGYLIGSRHISYTKHLYTDRYFANSHEWISVKDGIGTVGLSHYAQDQLGDVVYVELPEIGDNLSQGEQVAVVESVKAASDIYAPLSGKVTEVNKELSEEPNLINSEPFESGWLFKIQVSDKSQLQKLMNESAYQTFLTEESH